MGAFSGSQLKSSRNPNGQVADRMLWIHRIDRGPVILMLLALAHGLWRLNVAPALFWDEGWTLMVARNWAERGFYGRLLAGQSTSPGLSAAFPVVASVAFSFRLLGIGVWQARLVTVLYTMGALWLLYCLARLLYSRRIAMTSLALVLLVTPFLPELHPLHLGRMVMAEMPMLFFLLAGYACLLLALQKSAWFALLGVLCSGVGLITKAQPLPFWLASLAVPLLMALPKRRWNEAKILSVFLVGSLAVRQLLPRLWQPWLARGLPSGTPIGSRLISAAAMVPVPQIRLAALRFTLGAGMGVALGLGYVLRTMVKQLRDEASSADLVRLALLTFAGSWLAWFVLLSVGWHRYLLPALFVGNIFAAKMLHDWTGGLDWRATVKHAARTLRQRQFRGQGLQALLIVILIAWTVPASTYYLLVDGIPVADTSVYQVAEYLNTQTSPDALIEGYTSELFFLLDRRYHYPPDEVNLRVIEAMTSQKVLPVDYDPLTADPDYLVVNWGFSAWIVYFEAIKEGPFRSIGTFGTYQIFERVR